MDPARSENDIPTLPAFPVPGVGEATPYFPLPLPPAPRPRSALMIDTAAEGSFAVGLAMNDVCMGILGASAAQLG
jgi:hypothetical protein